MKQRHALYCIKPLNHNFPNITYMILPKKGKVFYGQEAENLLPQNVESIINYLVLYAEVDQ